MRQTELSKHRRDLRYLADAVRAAGQPKLAEAMEALARRMHHSRPVRKAPDKSPNVTPAMAAEIRRVAMANPDWNYMEIAHSFGVSAARVSEALRAA